MDNLQQYLFIDIETVSTAPDYAGLPPDMQEFWNKKANALKLGSEMLPEESYVKRAAIYSEFAKVVCISLGCFIKREEKWKFYLRALTGHDEQDLLGRFCQSLHQFTERNKNLILCGHNIKEFDIPFLCRRMVIHRMSLPDCLDTGAKKPWEVSHADTMELWRFGDKKSFTSLELLAAVLDIPTPKDDIDGSMVGPIYWQERDLQRIGTYCSKDVLTAAKVFLRLKGIPDLDAEPVYLP